MLLDEVPLETYPDTYTRLPHDAAPASQKRLMSLYLMGIYAVQERGIAFEQQYRATGKRSDVGKSCVRFRTLDGLPPDLIGRTIAALPADVYVRIAEGGKAGWRPR